MTAEQHLRNAKNQPVPNKVQIRRARIIAFVLVSATVITLALLVFAFIQKQDAGQARLSLLQSQLELRECRGAK